MFLVLYAKSCDCKPSLRVAQTPYQFGVANYLLFPFSHLQKLQISLRPKRYSDQSLSSSSHRNLYENNILLLVFIPTKVTIKQLFLCLRNTQYLTCKFIPFSLLTSKLYAHFTCGYTRQENVSPLNTQRFRTLQS